jgi:hypothetical protein
VTTYREPEVVNPRELEPGDQVGCTDAGPTLYPIVGEHHNEDPLWFTLVNEPGKTVEIPEYGWMRPLRHGNTALDLADHGWIWGVLPQVLARRVAK